MLDHTKLPVELHTAADATAVGASSNTAVTRRVRSIEAPEQPWQLTTVKCDPGGSLCADDSARGGGRGPRSFVRRALRQFQRESFFTTLGGDLLDRSRLDTQALAASSRGPGADYTSPKRWKVASKRSARRAIGMFSIKAHDCPRDQGTSTTPYPMNSSQYSEQDIIVQIVFLLAARAGEPDRAALASVTETDTRAPGRQPRGAVVTRLVEEHLCTEGSHLLAHQLDVDWHDIARTIEEHRRCCG